MYKSVWDFGREGKANYSVHGIGEYPSKIRPIVFHNIVERFSKLQDTVLDSFGGCGTLSVEAKLQGRNSISFDVNENAVGLAREKIGRLSSREMIGAYNELIGDLRREKNKIAGEFTLNGGFKKLERNERLRVVQIDKQIRRYESVMEKIKSGDSGLTKTSHRVEVGDARSLDVPDESVDCVVSDIPYSDMIRYSSLKDDLSNIEKYDDFLLEMWKAFDEMIRVLKSEKYLIIFVADNRIGASRKILPLHSDVIQHFIKRDLNLFDLYVWRYYRSGGFRPFGARPFQAMNVHTYILVFYKPSGNEKEKKNESGRYRKKLTEKIKNNEVKR